MEYWNEERGLEEREYDDGNRLKIKRRRNITKTYVIYSNFPIK